MKKNLLAQNGIPIASWYKAEIFFETGDLNEEQVERGLRQTFRNFSDPDLADYDFTGGSPASSPYITVTGKSRKHVTSLTVQMVNFLKQLGLEIVTS